MKKIIAVLLLCVFAACAATSKFAPAAEEMPAMQIKAPGITYDEAVQGYKLYVGNCSNCHRLHNPKEYTVSKWNKILPEMYRKAKIADSGQQQLIRNYLAAKSK
ncbi:MAG: hypothetical protein ABJA79_10395 [Parafilimonas sp.]